MLGLVWRWRANAEMGTRLIARLARDFPREHEPCPIGYDRALDNCVDHGAGSARSR
jgi:5'-methylthioadenosine phosphorylase